MQSTKKTIRALYKSGKSLKQIGEQFGVSRQTILNWMRKWKLHRRAPASTKKWNARQKEIEYLYQQQRMSQNQIAEYYGVGQSTIYKVMKRLKMMRRTRGRKGPEHHGYKDGSGNRDYRKVVVKNQCSHCGGKKNLGIHHKNNDHYDNRIENLEVLCNSCHMSISKKAWWAAKKAGKKLPKSNAPLGWKRAMRS